MLIDAASTAHEDPVGTLQKLEDGARDTREAAGKVAGNGAPKLWRAKDLQPAAPVRWLAKNRLARDAVNLLVGDEGIGKSLWWVYVVAAVTCGKPLPELGIPARDPAHVFVVFTEDDWKTTVLPRLKVAGADLDMITVICEDDDGSGSPVFPRDMHLIEGADPAPALVVVDAWLDTVPAKLSVKDPQQARQALHPWREMATRVGAAVLLLCHTNRVASGNTRDKYGATSELRNKARLSLFALKDDEGHLVIGTDKRNIARETRAARFETKSIEYFAPSEDSDGTVPLLVYVGGVGTNRRGTCRSSPRGNARGCG
jgi:RecA-family ATPase